VTSQEARDVLLRYRPGTVDEADPEVLAALAVAERDLDLAEWLEDHRRFQDGVRQRLGEIPLPAGLSEQIIAEHRAARVRWQMTRRRVLVGVGVGVMGLLVGRLAWPRGSAPENTLARFRSRMVGTVLRGYAMELESGEVARVAEHLAERQAQLGWPMEAVLVGRPLMGCAVLTWQSRPAVMLCYGRGGEPEVWMFVVASETLHGPPAGGVPVFAQVHRMATASWAREGKVVLVAGRFEEAELRGWLRQAG
jgi:hypothetical protein